MRPPRIDDAFKRGVDDYLDESSDTVTWLRNWMPNTTADYEYEATRPNALGHGIAQAASIERAAEVILRGYVAQAREHDITWQQIAEALGTTRQAAQQRFS